MSDPVRRVYWDTGLFLCFLNKLEVSRRLICEDVLKHAREGQIEIYTSYWTAVEVIRPKGFGPGALTEAQVDLIKGMFEWPWLKKVQVHQNVAFKAADLSRQYGLKPADAIHAATALVKNVDAMQVFDRDFSKVAHLLKIEQPQRLSKQSPLVFDEPTIGPTPEKIENAGLGTLAYPSKSLQELVNQSETQPKLVIALPASSIPKPPDS